MQQRNSELHLVQDVAFLLCLYFLTFCFAVYTPKPIKVYAAKLLGIHILSKIIDCC